MVAKPSFRLVKPPAANAATDPIVFERRQARRHIVNGRITAVEQGADTQAPNRISSIQLIDISDTGVGALAQEPIALDTELTLYIPPHGPERGYDLCGRVVRCLPREGGHQVGIRFETPALAA